MDDDDDDTTLESASKENCVAKSHTCSSLLLYLTATMSYASANVQPSAGGAVPHVDASFITDPDKARKERAKVRLHDAEDHAKAWYHQVSERIWVPGVAVRLILLLQVYMYLSTIS